MSVCTRTNWGFTSAAAVSPRTWATKRNESWYNQWIVRLTNQPHQPTQAIYQATYPNSVQPSHSLFSEIEIINKKIYAQAFSVFSFLYKKQACPFDINKTTATTTTYLINFRVSAWIELPPLHWNASPSYLCMTCCQLMSSGHLCWLE